MSSLTVTTSKEPEAPSASESAESPARKPYRVLSYGQIPVTSRGKFIQCEDGTRLGINATGSVVNLDKNRAFERALRQRVGKKQARKLMKQMAVIHPHKAAAE